MLKMLIVEDEKWEREGLLDFLDWNNMDIEIAGLAGDGIEGLEKARNINPDIIITDIKMPGMDGLEMSKRVRSFLPQVKIVILTGYDDFKFAKEAISFNAYEYLLKPVEEEEMLAVMKRVVKEYKNYLFSLVKETSLVLYTILEKDEDIYGIKNELSSLSSLNQMKASIFKIYKRVLEYINEKRNNKDEHIIKKVIKLIEEKYMTGINLRTIAAEVFLSPNYLGKIFKKNTGMAFNTYLNDYRMEKAGELLQAPENKVVRVAEQVGISNTSYFCVLFKNTYGITPGEYQEIYIRK